MKVLQVRVGDLLQLRRELLHVDPGASYTPIGVRSFANGLIRYPSCTGAELSKMRYFKLPPGSLVVSNIKAWEGAVALASVDDGERVVSNRFLTYTPRTKDVCLRYIWHYFASDPGTRHLAQASPGSADRNRTLGIKAFEDLVIPLPDLDEQRATACWLDTLFDGASEVRRADAQAASGEDSIRRQIFGSATSEGTQGLLGDLVQPAREFAAVEPERNYPNFGVLNRGRGLFKKPAIRGSETSYKHLYPVRAGQLIYSKLFAWEGSVTMVHDSYHGHFVSSEFPHFDIDATAIDHRFLHHLVRADEFTMQLRALASGMGQRRQRVNVDRFLNIAVSVPDRQTQERASKRLHILDRTNEMRARRARLATALPQAARNAVFAKLL